MNTMIWNTFKSGLAIAMFSFTVSAPAEDIDLFMGAVPPTSVEIPNVLIVIDNTANWSTAFTAEMSALAATVAGLDATKIRLGFMMYTETGSGNSNPDGAYVRAAVRSMSGSNKTLYQNLVNSFHVNNDKSNNGKLGLTMSEVNRYFTGTAAYAGANKQKRDYAGNSVSGLTASNNVYALAGNALASSTATTYQSPVASGCQKNFVIFLSNGKSGSNNSDNSTATSHLSALGGNTATISLVPSGSQNEVADEWSRYLANKSTTKVTTYTIDVVPTNAGQYSLDYKALLQSMATQGNGKYFNVGSAGASDVGAKIKEALDKIFTEIQAKNSVFASASLPVSVNTQGTYLNQVFIGMFRPDSATAPRWTGNMKQYKFKASVSGDSFALNLVDADDVLAINYTTGFIGECARSFWTPTTVDSYWNYTNSKAEGSCSTATIWSDTPDGNVVEKGAAGYGLRQSTPARVVKTCASGTCATLTAFDTTISPSAFGLVATDTAGRDALVNWTIGADNLDENGNSNVTERRPSIHGDVVHSRPVAIDYGGTTGVVVYYGANDGMLHAINGNQAGTNAGRELWAFVAPDQYGKLKRIRDNSALITFPSVGDATAKPYFFDGPVTSHKDGSTVYIYATQRRGGRMVYAFDVSTPSNPSLKWRKGCSTPLGDDTGCQTDYTAMGQAWSAPKVFKAEGYASGTTKKPMLIMGGGYDTCEDVDDGTKNNNCASTKGNRVFVLDADDGTLLKTFTTVRSVPADVVVVPNASTGLGEYAYVTDTGGNVYRIVMGSAAPASWTMTKIAALGCNAPACTAGGVSNRKFLFAPEVVITPTFNAVLVGSGDREHPLSSHVATKAVANAFYMLKDKPTNATWLSDESTNCGGNSVLCHSSLLALSNTGANASQTDLDVKKGWYMALSSTEQVVTSAVTLFGEVTFSTHLPQTYDVGSCGSGLGVARVYNIAYLTANPVSGETSRFGKVEGDGLAPSPVSGMVTVTNPSTGLPMTVPFIIGASNKSPVEVKLKSGSSGVVGNKERVYWYIQQ